ncbi:sulfotransferase domain-containing protein [Fulvivirga sp.]|uniref:sulfotransferase domain-containing protein n=1 Tax=Fulvivirga sp. TaxID=1931237 RepID=UPI0032EEF8D6
MKRLPDFLIIGAGKSGTTSLDNYLKLNPEIFMSPVKEPNFFAYDQIDLNILDKDALAHYHESVTKLSQYQSLFEEAQSNQVLGETSNTYLVINGTAEVIHSYIPKVKLIAILRQPTKRLYSRYLHLARENELPSENFADALDKDSIWWVRNDLVKEGFYYTNLKRYYDIFPKENIRVYLYEDLKENLQGTLDDIFSFLNVNEPVKVERAVEYNKSGFIKNKFYDKTVGHNSFVKTIIKKALPNRVYERMKSNQWLQKKVTDIQNSNLARPELDDMLYQQITHDVYAEEIKKLSVLINRDLTHWL